MRVICIKGDFVPITNKRDNYPIPKEGEVYTVVSIWECKDGVDYYNLEEFPKIDDTNRWFDSTCFVPCSDIDNIQLTEEQAESIRKRRDLNLVNSWIDKLEKAWTRHNED